MGEPVTSGTLGRERWVKADAVAEHLGLSRSRVLQLARHRLIPALALPADKPSGRTRTSFRFKLSVVEAWAERRAKGRMKP